MGGGEGDVGVGAGGGTGGGQHQTVLQQYMDTCCTVSTLTRHILLRTPEKSLSA